MATFAYTTVYLKDVAKSIELYAKAFGFTVRRLDKSHRGYASPKIDFRLTPRDKTTKVMK